MVMDGLESYLSSLAWMENLRVERVVKQSARETTELVWARDASGQEVGPFVRKTFPLESPLGHGYRDLFEAQKQGMTFTGVPRIVACYEDGRSSVILLEYIPGENLESYIERHGPSVSLAAQLFPLLCDAVIELHEKPSIPFIHRDLKPSNIIVESFNASVTRLVVIDFGIARSFKEGADRDTSFFGTRDFAPPEQFGYGQTDTRSDEYALGCVLMYMLCGTVPKFPDFTTTLMNAQVPSALITVALKACSFDPNQRYRSVRELKGAFLGSFSGFPINENKQPSTWNAQPSPMADYRPFSPHSVSNSASNQAANQAMPYTRHETTMHPGSPMPLHGGGAPQGHGYPDQGYVQPRTLRVSEVIGVMWDAVLGLFWLLIMVACVVITVAPSGSVAVQPLGFRVLEFFGFLALLTTGLCYIGFDTRFLRRSIPWLSRQTIGRRVLIGGLMIVVAFLSMVVAATLIATGIVPSVE